MIRGLYTAAAGMTTQQRKHDTVTNNIANLNTPGFKQVNAVSRSFPDVLISLINGGGEGPASQTIGRLNTGVIIEEMVLSFTQGDLQETGKMTDFALLSNIQVFEMVLGEPQMLDFDASGKAVNNAGDIVYRPQAFFTVWNAEGEERYTRNGQFVVNEAGELLNTDGYRVIGQAGEPINLALPLSQVRMGENGFFYNAISGEPVLDEMGDQVALLISQIDNPHRLIREGSGIYQLTNPEENPARPIDVLAEVNVLQGFIERSNVDPAQSMVDMMTALRMYEANQKVIQFYDKSLEKAVNEVGRV